MNIRAPSPAEIEVLRDDCPICLAKWVWRKASDNSFNLVCAKGHHITLEFRDNIPFFIDDRYWNEVDEDDYDALLEQGIYPVWYSDDMKTSEVFSE